MDLTEAFAPGGGAEDLAKTDFFDFVVSPPPHCASADVVSEEDGFLHRTTYRSISFLQDTRRDDHDGHSSPFIKETNNNTLTALPPVSTITGSLSHHHVRNHVQHSSNDQVPMEECDYWGSDDNKEQTCNILLEDLNKYCWSTGQATTGDEVSVHQGNEVVARSCATSNSRQNTDGAIYTLTVLNNEANSMDGLECCKSPPVPSDTWTLRPNLDLDAILSMESSTVDRVAGEQTDGTRSTVERFTERFAVPLSSVQFTTDDSGFVESKELCRVQTTAAGGDNNNDWKLSDQNTLQDATTASVVVTGDSAESLLRSALQGKLYTGPAQVTSASQVASITIPVTNANSTELQLQQSQQIQRQQSIKQEPMTCTDEDLLLSQLDTPNYRPGDYEKLKTEVVESYCSLEQVCNVAATATVMYTLDPTSGSLGTITLPADLGQVGTVTVVTAAQQDVLQQATQRPEEQQQNTARMQITRTVGGTTTKTKKYSRKSNKSNASVNANGNGSNGNGNGAGQQQVASPGSVQRKERSLHYCSICQKGFKDKYSVNVHIRTHTGEKPFACTTCGKSFRQKAHLAKHYQTHVAQKPNVQSSSISSNSSGTSPSTPTEVIASKTSNNNNQTTINADQSGCALTS